MEWLIPICLFWILAMTFLGGSSVDVDGGSPFRQVMGVVDAFVLFLLIWAGLRAALGGMGFAGRVLIPTLVVTFGFPLVAWVAFRIMGVRFKKTAPGH